MSGKLRNKPCMPVELVNQNQREDCTSVGGVRVGVGVVVRVRVRVWVWVRVRVWVVGGRVGEGGRVPVAPYACMYIIDR